MLHNQADTSSRSSGEIYNQTASGSKASTATSSKVKQGPSKAPWLKKKRMVRMQEEIRTNAKRIAEFNICLKKLQHATWMDRLPVSHEADLRKVLDMFNKFCSENTCNYGNVFSDPGFSDSMLAWNMTCYQCLRTLAWRGMLPEWWRSPTDKVLKMHAGASADEYHDPGNENLETLWFAWKVWTFLDARCVDTLCSPNLKQYGSTSQKSGRGKVNYRGNMLESIYNQAMDYDKYYRSKGRWAF